MRISHRCIFPRSRTETTNQTFPLLSIQRMHRPLCAALARRKRLVSCPVRALSVACRSQRPQIRARRDKPRCTTARAGSKVGGRYRLLVFTSRMARGRSRVGAGGVGGRRRRTSSGEQRAVVSGACERPGLASAYAMVFWVLLHVAVILGSRLCDHGGGSRGSIYRGIVTSSSSRVLHSGHGFIHQKRRETGLASRAGRLCHEWDGGTR